MFLLRFKRCPIGRRIRRRFSRRLALELFSTGAAALCANVVLADTPIKVESSPLAPVLITGKRLPPDASDEQVTQAVVQSIKNDPWIFAEHVTIITRNGVVHIEGRVTDRWDLFHILDRARKIAGRRRIVNELEYDPADDDSD